MSELLERLCTCGHPVHEHFGRSCKKCSCADLFAAPAPGVPESGMSGGRPSDADYLSEDRLALLVFENSLHWSELGMAKQRLPMNVCQRIAAAIWPKVEQLRAQPAKSPLSPPPTSEPSEELTPSSWPDEPPREVTEAMIALEQAVLRGEREQSADSLFALGEARAKVDELILRAIAEAARRASRVEMTGETAGASLRDAVLQWRREWSEISEGGDAGEHAIDTLSRMWSTLDKDAPTTDMTLSAVRRIAESYSANECATRILRVLKTAERSEAPQSVDAAASHREPARITPEWCMEAFYRVNPGAHTTLPRVPSLYLLDFAREVLRSAHREPSGPVTREKFNEVAGRWIPDEVADAMEAELFGEATRTGQHHSAEVDHG